MPIHERTSAPVRARAVRNLLPFAACLLLIEFVDELLFGVREAAWPLMRDDLRLSYLQVGLILSVPAVVGNLIEPALGILADLRDRRTLILAGGVAFAAATLLTGLSYNFATLLAATVLLNPASGAFVSISQAELMDAEPARREKNMARWTFFGSLGNAIGPLAVGAVAAFGLSWRWLFAGLAALALVALAAAWRAPFSVPASVRSREGARFSATLRGALREMRRVEVLRWLMLLQFGDFTWDVLRGFLALYFVDVVGVSEAWAAVAVVAWTWAGLPGDLLLIPLLERVRGTRYLTWSTSCVLVLLPAFLLAEGLTTKLVLLALLGLVNAGWYSILQAQLYAAMPGRSGTVLAVSNVFGLAGSLTPLLLGAFAQRYGLEAMMWLLLAGPAVMLLGLLTARRRKDGRGINEK